MDDFVGSIQKTACLLTQAATEEPPRPAECLSDDPVFMLRFLVGCILLGVIALAVWLYYWTR